MNSDIRKVIITNLDDFSLAMISQLPPTKLSCHINKIFVRVILYVIL